MAGNQTVKILFVAALLGCVLTLTPGAGAATHYPPGATCYDCHAVSQSKMIVGTRLIKKSQKTFELGMGEGDTAIRCLFCHEKDAVSVPGRTTMRGVWDHFKPTSRSKHTVAIASTFSETTTNRFDCLDCHTGIAAGVEADTFGNARIHGRDASAATHLDPYATLIGAPANADELSANTCQAGACHDGDGGATGGYTAPPLHSFAATTINDGAAPNQCTDCHGTHNSYQGDALIVLRTDGSTSNDPAASSPLVTPEMCGACHSADDGDASSDFEARGHGRSNLAGGGLTCANCHAATVPHSFAGGPAANPMRFAVASYNEAAELKSGLSGKASEGMCMLCHNTYKGLIHNKGHNNVSCQDCHEAHGKGMGSPGDYNTRMVRRQVPMTGGATDTMIYQDNVATDYWDPADTGGARGSSRGVCDNADCHYDAVDGIPEFPTAALVDATPSHTGGTVDNGAACVGCHSHSSDQGVWAAGEKACGNCHGYPPATNAHVTHVTTAQFGCENCHPGPGVTNHNDAGVASATDFNAKWALVRDEVDVAFTGSPYPSGSYFYAKDARPDDNTTYGTCNTACHGSGLDLANQGTLLVPRWSRTDTLLGAGNGDGACGTCHDVARDGNPANTPNTGNHLYHVATTAGNLGFGCQACHVTSTADGQSVIAGSHVDGQATIAGGGSFSGVAVSLTFADPTCSAISCHGGYSPVTWGAALGNCANCHGTFSSTGGMVGVVAKHKNADWTLTGFDTRHRGTALPGTNGEGYCDWCHNNTQAVYSPAKVAGGVAQGQHLDGKVQLNAEMGYIGTSATGQADTGCATACHSGGSPYQMADSNLPLDKTQSGQTFGCGACHNDGTVPPTSGAHGIHLTAARGGPWTDTDPGDYSACVACHGNNGGAGYTIANGGGSDGDTHGQVGRIVTFNTPAVIYTNLDGIPANADDTCATTNCHSPGANTSNWAGVTPEASIGCDACHYWAAAPTSAANTANGNPLGGSHGDHFAGAARSRQLVCTDCHADNGTDLGGGTLRTHISNQPGTDGAVLTARANAAQDAAAILGTVLGTTGTNPDVAPWGTDLTSNATCDNLQCHNPSNDGRLSPAWGTLATGSCETCHGGSAATPPTSFAHPAHTASTGGYSLSCNLCHASTTADGTTISTPANHVNLLAEVAFDVLDPRLDALATYGGTATVGDAVADLFDTCAAVYCHGATLGAGGTNTTPEWNLPATGACGTCHSATNPATNGHTAHVTAVYGPRAVCGNCHTAETAVTTHVDGVKSFTAGGTLAATTACDTCHNGSPTVAKSEWPQGAGHWLSTTGYCEHCHDATPSTVNTLAGTGGVNLVAPVKTTYWDATTGNSGHGLRSLSSYPWGAGRSGAALVCTNCHDATQAHIGGASPVDRLATVGNALCTDCHDGTGIGVNAQTRVSTHANSSTTMTSAYTRQRTEFELNCIECHDVHGSPNIFMIAAVNPDGPLVATRLYNGSANTSTFLYQGTVDFRFDTPAASTTLGTGYVDGRTGNGSYASKICQTCHTTTVHFEFDSNDGHINTDCIVCHKHDYENDGVAASYASNSQDGFMPIGCSDCHGGGTAGTTEDNFWPDGSNANPENIAGRHELHLARLATAVYSQTLPQLLGDPASAARQTELCSYCHTSPGADADHASSLPAEVNSMFTLWSKTPDNGVYAAAADTCATVDCHNNKLTTDGTFGWYDAGLSTCTLCHTAGGAGNDPVSGLHSGTLTVSGNAHDDSFADGNAGTANCQTCHTAAPSTAHINGVFTTTAPIIQFAPAVTFVDAATPTCAPGAALATCHDDGGAWVRLWSATAKNSDGSQCANCHGGVTAGYADAAFVAGIGASHASAPIPGNHSQCYYCHLYQNGNTADYNIADAVQHRDGRIEIGASAIDGNGTQLGFTDNGATVGCDNCHTANDGVGAGLHEFTEVSSTRWLGRDLITTGPDFDCNTCHTDNGAIHNSTNESAAVHTTHTASVLVTGCADCHANPGASGHNNNTVTFSGTKMTTPASYPQGSFAGTCTNTCHATGGVLWATGALACTDCHSDTYLGGGANMPTSGLHNIIPSVSGQQHGAGLGCANCHNTVSGLATHMNGAFTGDTLANLGLQYYTQTAANTGTCVNTTCHLDNTPSGSSDDWAHMWTNAAGYYTTSPAACGGCHGDDANNFNVGVSHVKTTDLNGDNVFGMHGGSGAYECKDCHNLEASAGYTFTFSTNDWRPADGTSTHGDGNITVNSNGTSYNQTTFYCDACHPGIPAAPFSNTAWPILSAAGDVVEGCNGCHGYPPVQSGQEAAPDLKLENYAGGGGMHLQHVQFLQGAAQLNGATDARSLCGPCHGDGAGSTNHLEWSGFTGAWNWATSSRPSINIRSRATGNSWDGMTGDPATSTYGGTAVTATGAAVGAGVAVNSTNSRCVGVDCHGNPASGDSVEVLWWNVNLAAASPGPGTEKSRTCEGCHDQTPAQLRVYNADGTGVYTGNAPNAATVYYGTVSGYSKGGHGDPTINSSQDPSFVNSGAGATPLECTACHNATVAHFPEAAGDVNRLGGTAIENTGHTIAGLCNTCHAPSSYPGSHHPSLYGGTPARDIKPAPGQQIYTVPSTWTDLGGGHYEQNGYSASGVLGNVDAYIDWWNGIPSSAPRPSPLATLPLLQYVGNQSGLNEAVMCVTCHNPHGTDLFTYDPIGGHQDIPANRMLRLRDSDNTLCNACHE